MGHICFSIYVGARIFLYIFADGGILDFARFFSCVSFDERGKVFEGPGGENARERLGSLDQGQAVLETATD